MLLAIDAGNTNTVFALSCDNEGFQHVWRCQTRAQRTADEYLSWLYPLFLKEGLKFDDLGDVIISSVVPEVDFNLNRLCRDHFDAAPIFITSDLIDMEVKLSRPEEAGADRLVNASAAVKEYSVPAVIIDFGTATTFDVIDGRGAYCGGVIAPGINLSITALHEASAKLPRVSIGMPDKVVGNDTVSAMRSGIYWGYVSLIEGLLTKIAAEQNFEDFKVIATGGLASLFEPSVDMIDVVDTELTLKGLLHIYKKEKL